MTENNNKESVNGRRGDSFKVRDRLFYLMVGGGVGAAVGLMLAPKSGADLRGDISDFSKKGIDQAKDLAANLKEQSSGADQSIKEKAETAYDMAASKMAGVQDAIDHSTAAAAEHVNGEILEGSNNSRSERPLPSGRKSSSIV